MNVRDLHDRTAEILRQAEGDTPVFVTRYGRPIAVIRGLAQEELEDLTRLTDSRLRNGLEEAHADMAARRVSGLDESTADYRSLRVAAEIAS